MGVTLQCFELCEFIANCKDVFVNCSQLLLVKITRVGKLSNLGSNEKVRQHILIPIRFRFFN